MDLHHRPPINNRALFYGCTHACDAAFVRPNATHHGPTRWIVILSELQKQCYYTLTLRQMSLPNLRVTQSAAWYNLVTLAMDSRASRSLWAWFLRPTMPMVGPVI